MRPERREHLLKQIVELLDIERQAGSELVLMASVGALDEVDDLVDVLRQCIDLRANLLEEIQAMRDDEDAESLASRMVN